MPNFYEIPLTPYVGIVAGHQTICELDISAAPFTRNLLIWGTIELWALDALSCPAAVDVEILVGDSATGELAARGIGRRPTKDGLVVCHVHPKSPFGVTPEDAQCTVYVNLVSGEHLVLCELNPESKLWVTEYGRELLPELVP